MRRGRASASCGTRSGKRHEMINEGDKAPDITVAASNGKSVNLAAPGGPLVLYFYPKDDTSGCTREAQDFTELAPQFDKAGVKVVGVSRDPMKKPREVHRQIWSHGSARLRRGRADFRRVRDLGPEVDVRPQIYGDGARDLSDRRRRPRATRLAQGQSPEPRSGRAGCGAGACAGVAPADPASSRIMFSQWTILS